MIKIEIVFTVERILFGNEESNQGYYFNSEYDGTTRFTTHFYYNVLFFADDVQRTCVYDSSH